MNQPTLKLQGKRGRWKQALISFFTPVLGVLLIRWALVEPFVIPSGSMIPTLLVHDHIFVNKLSYGLHWPFGKKWITQWSHPQKGEIAVFRYPENPEIFYVKRLVATAGDEISVDHGVISINGIAQEQIPLIEGAEQNLHPGGDPSVDSNVDRKGEGIAIGDERDETSEKDETSENRDEIHNHDFDYFQENGFTIRYLKGRKESSHYSATKVPEKSFFVIGDNRDQSSDSRYWGFVPEENLVGKPAFIWLSCDKTLQSAPFICDPQSLRWSRIFHWVQSR